MPEIDIRHRHTIHPQGMEVEEVSALGYLIARECAKLLSVPTRSLTADSFDVINKTLESGSRQKQDVVIRIDLHNDPERLEKDQHLADQLTAYAWDALNHGNDIKNREPRSVRVYLVFAHIAYADASKDGHVLPQDQ